MDNLTLSYNFIKLPQYTGALFFDLPRKCGVKIPSNFLLFNLCTSAA